MLTAIRFLLLCASLLASAIADAQFLPPAPPPPPPSPPPTPTPTPTPTATPLPPPTTLQTQIPIVTAGQAMPGLAAGLIVWVHGCCTNESDVETLSDSLSAKYTNLLESGDWDIVVWDWSAHTPKWDWNAAYNYAQMKGGSELASAIAQSPNRYTPIHLIGHSAGANLIHEASQLIAVGLAGTPFIHLTFLDAFTPDEDAKQKYGRFPIAYPHYSEHYVDRTFSHPIYDSIAKTNEILPQAFNFNITDWIHSPAQGDPGGHLWPLNWYIMSITQPTLHFLHLKYGHPLSREGGNQLINVIGSLYPPAEQSPSEQITLDTRIPLPPPAARCGPEVTNVTFPPSIPVDGTRATGTVTFTDCTIENIFTGDINWAQFDVLGKTGSGSFTPFGFDPELGSLPSGSFTFDMWCEGDPLYWNVKLTLKDKQNNVSNPYTFAGECTQ